MAWPTAAATWFRPGPLTEGKWDRITVAVRRAQSPNVRSVTGMLRHGQAHVVVGAIAGDSGVPPIDNRLVGNRVIVNQREKNLGPELFVPHAAVGGSGQTCGFVMRENNEATRADQFGGSVDS